MKKLIFLLPMLCLLCSCFRGKPIDYPFKDISLALKKEFMKDKDAFEYVKPEIEEEPGYMYLYQPKYVDFYLVLHITVKLKKETEKTSKIMIEITEYNRQWKFGMREKDMEKDFLNALEGRMETGKWGLLPWDLKYKRKQNDF